MPDISSIIEKLEKEIKKDKKEMYQFINKGVVDRESVDAILKAKYVDMLQINKIDNRKLCEEFIQSLIDKA